MGRKIAFLFVCAAGLYGQRKMYWQEACFKNPRAPYCRERDWVPRPTPKEPVSKSVFINPAPARVRPRPAPALTVVGRLIPADPATEASPVKLEDDKAAGIVVGTAREEVLRKLGAPYTKISGDFERYTYLLESGNTLKLDFENGRVTEVRK